MTTILYVGDRVSGSFAEEVARERGYTYHQIPCKNASARATTNEVTSFVFDSGVQVDVIIYDVEGFIDEAEVIAAEIAGVAKTLRAVAVVYMPTFLPGSAMAQALFARDIKRYIFAGTLADLKDQLIKNVTGFYDANVRKEIAAIEEKRNEATARIEHFRSIGFCGSQERVGTTTMALQAARYIQQMGYRAAYVQVNRNLYFDTSRRSGENRAVTFVEKYMAWSGQVEGGRCVHQDMDMYLDASNSWGGAYDYFVYDYGCIFDRDFDRTAFMKDDVRIVVGGAKPHEFDALERIFDLAAYDACSIIVTMTDTAQREEMLKPMASEIEKGRLITFAEHTADPFAAADARFWQTLIPIEKKEEEKAVAPQKKRKLLKRGKKT